MEHHAVLLMRTELERLRKEHRFMREKAEEQKYIITKLLSESKRNNKEEVSKWHKQKKTEEVIKMLRTKLKDAANKENDIREKLEKREKRLDKSMKNEESRQREIERMNKRLQDLKEQRDLAENESRQLSTSKDRMQAELDRRETETTSLMAKVRKLERTNAELQLQLLDEKKQSPTDKHNLQDGMVTQSEQVENIECQLTALRKELEVVEMRHQTCQDKLAILEKDHGTLIEEHSKVIRKLEIYIYIYNLYI
uniref:Myosin_tail_1 domain-containing protein n=1 Tax=Heterorhabditis bacteriophora TaxID=37862 RepID=A0A1I7X0N1_HETBA